MRCQRLPDPGDEPSRRGAALPQPDSSAVPRSGVPAVGQQQHGGDQLGSRYVVSLLCLYIANHMCCELNGESHIAVDYVRRDGDGNANVKHAADPPIILDHETELVVQPIGHETQGSDDNGVGVAVVSETRDVVHSMKIVSMSSRLVDSSLSASAGRKISGLNTALIEHRHQRCVFVSERFAWRHGFKDGDIVQLFHHVIIRIVKTEQQKLQEQQQQQQQQGMDQALMMKEFDERKERRWTFARVCVIPILHHLFQRDIDPEKQQILNALGQCTGEDVIVHDNMIMELGAMDRSTVFLKYVAASGSQELSGMGSMISNIYVKQIIPHAQQHSNGNEGDSTPLLEEMGEQATKKLLKQWIAEQQAVSSKKDDSKKQDQIPLSQRNVITVQYNGKNISCLVSFNETVFPYPDGMKNQEDLVEFGLFVGQAEQTGNSNSAAVEKNIFLLGVNQVEAALVNILKGRTTIKLHEPIHRSLPSTVSKSDPQIMGHSLWKEQLRYKTKKSTSIRYALQQLSSIFLRGSRVDTKLGNIVISGHGGMGTTTFAKILATHFDCLLHQERGHRIERPYVVYVQCATMAGDRTDTQIAKLRSYLFEALAHNPSIVILDNLDAICPMEQEEMMPDPNTRVLASVLCDMIATIQRSFEQPFTQRLAKCCFIATCSSFDISVHKFIQNSRLFDIEISLQLPDINERRQLVRAMLDNQITRDGTLSDELMEHIVRETEGFSPRDLHLIFEKLHRYKIIQSMRADMQRKRRQRQDPSPHHHDLAKFTMDDFAQVRKDFQISSTEGIKLVKDSPVKWDDVGGLDSVKAVLRETFEFPTKYARLFKNAPIKLRQGLLLYGPPGCGKTMLASAVAKECGLGFISVKGPELLNKYIGQSEHQVRQLFEQAQQAAPCIIFFDEFDSLAAKRGHDNTGVTDRVVNQLLTQLDGVEERRGVYVLAATSRPDLIDAALLRPGRLDKCLKCGFPTVEERIDILKKASMSYELDIGATDEEREANWRELAERCENFSGADLQGFISTANLVAVHEYLAKMKQIEAEKLLEEVLQDGDELGQEHRPQEYELATRKQLLASKGAVPDNKGKRKAKHSGIDTMSEQDAMQQQIAQMVSQIERLHLQVPTGSEGTTSSPIETGRHHQHSNIIITMQHLREAIKSSRPSLGTEERAYFDYIYESFQSSREASGDSSQQQLQKILQQQMRATLA